MNADLLQGFYLGDLLVEPLKGEVTGQVGSRHLPPKAAEVLSPGNALATGPARDDIANYLTVFK